MMKSYLLLDDRWKKITFISFVFLAVGIVLIVKTYLADCVGIINKHVKDDFIGRRSAVYIIKDVNIGCRPCSKYDELSRDNSVNIVFYVEKDYSNIDIENFRKAFGIPEKYIIERIGEEWEKIYKKCDTDKNFSYNLLVLLNENGKVEEIRRF